MVSHKSISKETRMKPTSYGKENLNVKLKEFVTPSLGKEAE